MPEDIHRSNFHSKEELPLLSKHAVEMATESMFAVDSEGRILEANDIACSRLEYSRAELTGMSISFLNPHYSEHFWKPFFEELSQKKRLEFETQQRTKTGRIQDVKIILSYFENHDQKYGCSWVHDITQEKELENLMCLQHDVLAQVASSSDLQQTLDLLCEMVEEFIPGSITGVMLIDPSDGLMRFESGPKITDEIKAAFGSLTLGTQSGSCGAAAHLLTPVFVSDTRSSPYWSAMRHIVDQFNLLACWATPIIGDQGNALGTFSISHPQPTEPTQFHHQILEISARLAGLAVRRRLTEQQLEEGIEERTLELMQRKVAEEKLAKSNALLEALQRAQSQFIENVNSRQLFDELQQSLLDITSSEYGFIGEVFFDTDGKPYLKTQAISNIAWDSNTQAFYEQNAPVGMEFRNLESLFGAVLTTNQPIVANSAAEDPRSGGIPKGHPPLNSFLGLPFFHGTKIVGMIGLANRPGGYDSELIAYLQPVLTACGAIIEGYRQHQEKLETDVKLKEAKDELEARVEKGAADLAKQSMELMHLQRLNTLGELGAGLGHELNQPLCALTNYAHGSLLRLKSGTLTDDVLSDVMSRIVKEATRASQIIDRVRNLARRRPLSRSDINVNELLENVAKLCSSEIKKKNIHIDYQLTKSLSKVSGDAVQIEQVVANLLRNAIDATSGIPESRRTITLKSEPDSAGAARISIRDMATGNELEDIEQLFESFFSTKSEGLGIGLPISRRIVEAHGGLLTACRNPDFGLEFSFTVPFKED